MPKNIKILFAAFLCIVVLLLLYELLHTQNTETAFEKTLSGTCPNPKDLACLKDLITKTILETDLAEGFKMLRAEYVAEPEFRPNCHPLALTIGTALGSTTQNYMKFSYTPESVWCNFGFYQGYPASLLLTTGDVMKARAFCEYVGTQLGSTVPDVEAECFRGIGRGLPFLKKEYWGDARRMATFAAQTCKDISPEKSEYDLCVHGAFNALGRASVAGKYGLSVNTADSLWLCREQPETLQHYCYENFKWAAVSLIENAADLSAQFHAIEKMYATTSRVAVEQTIISLGYDEGRKSVVGSGVDYSAIRSCALLPPPYVSDCVWGFAFGLAKHGTPGSQHVQVIQFCAAAMNDIPSLQKTDCSSEAIRYLRGFYSPSQFKSACQDFKTELGVPC